MFSNKRGKLLVFVSAALAVLFGSVPVLAADPGVPATGDTAQPVLWITLLILVVLLLIVLLVLRKKKKK